MIISRTLTAISAPNGQKILQSQPWTAANDSVPIKHGTNVFWMSHLPAHLKLGDRSIRVIEGAPLSFDRYERILKPSINMFMSQLRVLKVINTDESKQQINCILSYFTAVEKYCESVQKQSDELSESTLSSSSTDINPASIKSRLLLMKNLILKNKRSIVIKMSQIANDNRIATLNSAQQAD